MAVSVDLFARQCEQVLDLACTLSDVASLAGLDQQEKRLQRIKAELSDIANQAADSPSTGDSKNGWAAKASEAVNSPKQASTSRKAPTLQISARDLCSNGENNRLAFNEAMEAFRKLQVMVQALQSEAENAGKESHLARTEACTAIAHAREAKSTVESHETRLRAATSECQHLRELMTDGFHRSNANAEAVQKHASVEVAELRESLACLDIQVKEARSQDLQLQKTMQHAWKDALSTVEELRTSSSQRHAELKENMRDCQRQLAEQHKKAQHVVDAELKEIRNRLDKRPQDARQTAQQCNATVNDMPATWQTMLEDVVRQSQWACEESRREGAKRLEEVSTALKKTWREASEEHAKLSSKACQQSSEALAAAQLSTEMARELEEVVKRRQEKLEGHVRTQLSAAADSLRQGHQSADDKLQAMGKDLDNAAVNVQKLGKSVKFLEGAFQDMSAGLAQTHIDNDAQRAKLTSTFDLSKRVDEIGRQLGSQIESVKADISTVDRHSKAEITALCENLDGLMNRVADTARYAAEQVAKKAADAARREAESETSAKEGLRQLAVKQAQAMMEQTVLDIDRKATRLHEAALEEVRNALSKALEELREMRMQVKNAAVDEARAGVTQKCDELVRFAGNLRQAALEEMRKALTGQAALAKD